MRERLSITFAAAAAAAAFLTAGCSTEPLPVARAGEAPTGPGMTEVAPETPFDPSLLKPAAGDYRLGPGDVLDIEMMGDAVTQQRATVGPDGKIYYYLLPGIDVWGLTIEQARDRIAAGLESYVREKPVISVSLHTAASRRYWLLGRVNHPGVYSMDGPTTLLDALAQAGGLSSASALSTLAASLGITATAGGPDAADLAHSFVIRDGRNLEVDFVRLVRDGDLSQNIYLQPGDFIYLPSAAVPQIYVLGAVAHPQAVQLAGPLTVVEALAVAGGAAPDACLYNVAVLRGSVAHPEIAILSVSRVLHGKDPDMSLQAGDIVFVPYTPYRTLARYANLILDTFARTVGVNVGAHAGGASAVSTVGVNVSAAP